MEFILSSIVAVMAYCPILTLIGIITPWRGFKLSTIRHRGRRYTTLHLSLFDRVGYLNRARASRFHRSFTTTLIAALKAGSQPVLFTSHLLRPSHLRSLDNIMATQTDGRRWRRCNVRISRGVRTGIRLQILLQEWRWITVPRIGILVVIGPCRTPRAR